ncbi:Dynein light chain roadblock-type [Echinococcus granulosus]|uniref:Dynein light chain roadblock-type n=1 Tax=Echinococcus granulosus TaxID=6210 RepID=W6U538_ECHGR|nr:Dynein light chain roadblock-type [Echinococcus granulosus]EUB56240.1 Dynein light chain roadblock-type [Echinococcus granulosus]
MRVIIFVQGQSMWIGEFSLSNRFHFSRLSLRWLNEVEDTFNRIQMHKGVQGIIIMNNDAVPIRTTMDKPMTVHYCALSQQLVSKSRAGVRDGDPTNDLTFLRVRSKKNEIMIAPDKEYTLIVVQEIGNE